MLELLNLAILIATKAHANQLDKCGKLYIWHPIRVAQKLAKVEEQIVAMLHDVVEDTDITLEELANLFPENIVLAIDAITQRKGEDHMEYIARCALNPLALRVKLPDLEDNMSPERLYQLDFQTQARVMQKYMKALEYVAAL